MDNPFAPGFGTQPPVLVGRDGLLRRIAAAMAAGPKHPDTTLVVTGSRGTGKTVLLNAAEASARSQGWATIAMSASEEGGLTRNLAMAAADSARWPEQWSRQAVGFGTDIEGRRPRPTGGAQTLRAALTSLASAAADRGSGVLVTVDELQSIEAEDGRIFANAIQHVARREQRPVVFLGAGLPEVEDTVLADDGITFFQRCRRAVIGTISDDDVRVALERPILDAGRWIEPDALETAVESASGFPFMVQLIGFHAWERASAAATASAITVEAMEAAIADASDEMVGLVIKPVWNRLSEADRLFLHAMAVDRGDSATADIAGRLGKPPSHVGMYRSRLIRAGVIAGSGHGRVRFTHEALRRWLRSRDADADSADV